MGRHEENVNIFFFAYLLLIVVLLKGGIVR